MNEPVLQHITVNGAAARDGAARRMAFWDWPSAHATSHHVIPATTQGGSEAE